MPLQNTTDALSSRSMLLLLSACKHSQFLQVGCYLLSPGCNSPQSSWRHCPVGWQWSHFCTQPEYPRSLTAASHRAHRGSRHHCALHTCKGDLHCRRARACNHILLNGGSISSRYWSLGLRWKSAMVPTPTYHLPSFTTKPGL